MSIAIRKIVRGKRTGRCYLVCCGKKSPIFGTGRDDPLDWDDEEVTATCPVCWFHASWGIFRDGTTEKIRLTPEQKAKRLPSPEEREAANRAWTAKHPRTAKHCLTCEDCSRMTVSIATYEAVGGKAIEVWPTKGESK